MNAPVRRDRSRWPELLRDCAERFGDAAALRLAGRIGGRKIEVPTGARPTKIDAEIGPELAAWLRETRGGLVIQVPNFAARLADERRNFVLCNPGLSANDIATRLGITSRRVVQIRSEARADPAQPGLFD